MSHAVRFAWKDIKGNFQYILLFTGQLLLCIYFLFAIGSYLVFNLQLGQQLSSIARRTIIGFSAKGNAEFTMPGDEVSELLKASLSLEGTAYAVLNSVYLPDRDDPLVVGLGKFHDIFGFASLAFPDDAQEKRPVVLIGSSVTDLAVGDELNLGQSGEESLRILKRLPKGSSYLWGTSAVNLDHSVLLMTSYDHFAQLYPWNTADVMSNLYLVDPSPDDIKTFLTAIGQSAPPELRPFSLSDTAAQQYGSTMFYIYFYLILYGCEAILISLGIVLSLHQLVDRNMQEYAIHRLYGATLRNIAARTLLYVCAITIFPFLLYPLYIHATHFMNAIPAPYIVGIAIFVTLLFSVFPIVRLQKYDSMFFLRRDF